MDNTTQEAILEQYRIYNYSKEKFIDRSFKTNRFYTSLGLLILSSTYIAHLLTPSFVIMTALCALGMFTSVLWWLNVVAYDSLIKLKYNKVLEVIEQSLPKQPFREEYKEFALLKSERIPFDYPDIQKVFSVLIFLTFTSVFVYNLIFFIKTNKGLLFHG